MNEQLSMFSDPLEEKALEIIRSAVERFGIESAFDSYYGGSRIGFDFFFDPRTKCFYYSDRTFNTYRPQPWVRKKTFREIKEIFGG